MVIFINNKIPLLGYTLSLFDKNKTFNKSLIISCQHILYTNYKMLDIFIKKGLKPENLYLIGKSYSINKDIEKKIINQNINYFKYKYFDNIEFDIFFNKKLDLFLEKVNKIDLNNFNEIIIIDDGGLLIKKFNYKFSKNILNKTFGVEQTSSGYNIIKNKNINFPIINIAKSKAKLNFESPFISKLCVRQIKRKIKKYNFDIKNILIFGGGAIGKNIKSILSKDFKNVKIFDLNKKYSDYTFLSLTKNLNKFDLIIGSTGYKLDFSKIYNKLKSNVVLVNVSSSDREFSDIKFLKNSCSSNPHKDIFINKKCLLNSGFPITFHGGKHGSPPKLIQLTQSLMLAGVYYGSLNKFKFNGILDLDDNIQNKIITKFFKINDEF